MQDTKTLCQRLFIIFIFIIIFLFRLYLVFFFSFNFHLWTSQWMLWAATDVDASAAVDETLEAIVKRRHLAFLCRCF